jgi:hypothetical protein
MSAASKEHVLKEAFDTFRHDLAASSSSSSSSKLVVQDWALVHTSVLRTTIRSICTSQRDVAPHCARVSVRVFQRIVGLLPDVAGACSVVVNQCMQALVCVCGWLASGVRVCQGRESCSTCQQFADVVVTSCHPPPGGKESTWFLCHRPLRFVFPLVAHLTARSVLICCCTQNTTQMTASAFQSTIPGLFCRAQQPAHPSSLNASPHSKAVLIPRRCSRIFF